MPPGDLPGLGMDEAGLRQRAAHTTTPPADNAAFAAHYIPQAHVDILPGSVGHEIWDLLIHFWPHAC